MSVGLLACRLLLAGVLITAGVAKLVDLAGSRRGAVELGVPGRLAGTAGVLLPLLEAAVAIFWNPGCGFCQRMLPTWVRSRTNPPPGQRSS